MQRNYNRVVNPHFPNSAHLPRILHTGTTSSLTTRMSLHNSYGPGATPESTSKIITKDGTVTFEQLREHTKYGPILKAHHAEHFGSDGAITNLLKPMASNVRGILNMGPTATDKTPPSFSGVTSSRGGGPPATNPFLGAEPEPEAADIESPAPPPTGKTSDFSFSAIGVAKGTYTETPATPAKSKLSSANENLVSVADAGWKQMAAFYIAIVIPMVTAVMDTANSAMGADYQQIADDAHVKCDELIAIATKHFDRCDSQQQQLEDIDEKSVDSSDQLMAIVGKIMIVSAMLQEETDADRTAALKLEEAELIEQQTQLEKYIKQLANSQEALHSVTKNFNNTLIKQLEKYAPVNAQDTTSKSLLEIKLDPIFGNLRTLISKANHRRLLRPLSQLLFFKF